MIDAADVVIIVIFIVKGSWVYGIAIFLFVTTVTLLTKATMAMAMTTMVALQKDPSNDNDKMMTTI